MSTLQKSDIIMNNIIDIIIFQIRDIPILQNNQEFQYMSKKNNLFVSFFKKLFDFIDMLTEDKVGIYAAQASFFIILSIFPFILLLLTLVGFTNSFDQDYIIRAVNAYFPESIKLLTIQMLNELYTHVSGTIISITAIGAIWSSSKGFLSVMFGLYNIYKVHEKRNYFLSRFLSMIYTVAFLFVMIVSMVLLVFGNRLFKLTLSYLPTLENISNFTHAFRYVIVFVMLTIFFLVIFRITNIKTTTLKKVLPGALFSSLGWIIFSYAFSIYVDNFSNMTYTYGSLTAVIIVMLWLYFCIYIFFIGAGINKFFHPEIVPSLQNC